MDVLTAISSRLSPAKLGTPAPNKEQLAKILDAGAAAPDHGRLAPWRFVVMDGPARAVLGDAMVAALKSKMPDCSAETLAQERSKVERAPMIVAVAARIAEGKIPAIEQIVAVGAAVQNMWLAAHALGFGAMWKTGGPAYDASVKEALGLRAADEIVAFLYLGTTLVPGQARARDAKAATSWL